MTRYRRRLRTRRRMVVGGLVTVIVLTTVWAFYPRGSPGKGETGAKAPAVAGRGVESPPPSRGAERTGDKAAERNYTDSAVAGRFTWPTASPGERGGAIPLAAAEPAPRVEPEALGPAPGDSGADETPRSAPPPAVPGDVVAASAARFERGERVAARGELNAWLKQATSAADARRAREQLARFADDMIFSPKRYADDPLITDYAIKAGDRLLKVGRAHKVPHGVIMRINNISDAGRIRENQRIKVPNGPFHARIVKSDFRIDLFLQDVYVRSFRVGLGAEPGTPEGVWRVKEKLVNPTFFPPASYPDKRIIAADDPKNPLGEHWIGLEGVEGAAVGHDGYGIHGTIEPDSIGRAVSHGCVRMLNDDVAFVADLLLPGESTVTVVP